MKLSILICTLPSRVLQLNSLLDNLLPQTKDKLVEILYLGDNKKRTVGQKRTDLVNLARGEYVCFIDDDDRIVDNYVEDILTALEDKPDCAVFNVRYNEFGQPFKEVIYDKDFENDKNFEDRYERLPNHLMVVKREIALVGFPDISRGEDFQYAKRIKNLIKTQKRINKTLYYYMYNNLTSET